MGQGLVGLGGAAGAAEGLETLLTRRLLERKQAEEERATLAQEAQQQAQLEEQKAYRAAQTAEAERSHTENERARRISLALMQPMGAYSPKTAIEPMLKDYPELSGFFDYAPEESKDEMGPATVGPDGKSVAGAMTTTVRPEGYRFRGKEADLIKKQTEDERNRDRDSDRQMRLTLAQLAASSRSDNTLRNIQIKQPDGTYKNQIVNANGEVVYEGNRPEPGGVQTRLGDLGSLDAQLGGILQAGEATQGAGLGPVTAQFGSARKKLTGGGSDQEDMFRSAIDSIRADIAHEKYGSAFTSTERGMLSSFAPSSSMSWPAARNRIAVMREVIKTRKAYLERGGTLDQAQTEQPVNALIRQLSTPSGTGGRGTGAGPATGSTGLRVISVEPF